jgi:hypothetical protein
VTPLACPFILAGMISIVASLGYAPFEIIQSEIKCLLKRDQSISFTSLRIKIESNLEKIIGIQLFAQA